MKKFAIGCLVVVVLFAIGGGIAGYWLYSKAKGYVAQFQALEKLDKKVTNVAVFAAPANGELTEDMVRRFVAVQERMSARLGARVAEMKAEQEAWRKLLESLDEAKRKRNRKTMIESVVRFIDFDKMDRIPMSEYTMKS